MGVALPLFVGFVVAGSVIYINIKPTLANKEDSGKLLSIDTEQIIANASQHAVDTDEDGLEDWEEVLWKTDINNPDTDGDEMSDGDEIDIGRNPLVAGPNDTLANTNGVDDWTLASTSEDLSPADKLARNFMGTYIQYRVGNGAMSDSAKNKMAASLVDSMTYSFGGDTTSIEDIPVIESPTEVEIIAYKQNISDVLTILQQIDEFEFITLANMVDNPYNTAPYAKRLRENAPVYDEAIEKLESMRVPKDALEAHYNFLKGAKDMRSVIVSLSNVNDDALSAMLGLSAYQDSADTLTYAGIGFREFFGSHGLTFR